MIRLLATLSALTLLTACQSDSPNGSRTSFDKTKTNLAAKDVYDPTIKYEKYTLKNGLQVILHVDKSDPIVGVNLSVGVGSAREVPGRTGLAHLFEHLLFLNSENLGYGGLDKLSTRIGGSGTNGFTDKHLTQYHQTAPADALEKLIWAEAEKIGYFINTVAENTLAVERQVVKNEKRQNTDEQAYGATYDVIGKLLYPANHPYSWQVIGSLEDLEAATLDDVKSFYKTWYVPNNTTFTVAGDFDPKQAKAFIQKYFGEIPRGADIPSLPDLPDLEISENISVYHEDRLASVAQLNKVWAGVKYDHPDSAALSMLTSYLSQGKKALLNQVLVEDLKLTSSVGINSYSGLLAGEIILTVNAKENGDLDAMLPAIESVFDRFEREGVTQEQLDRMIERDRIGLFSGLENVATKASELGLNNTMFGDPNYTVKLFDKQLLVTPADVMRVFKKYLKGQPYLATSFVPEGSVNLALKGASKVEVYEEVIGAATNVPSSGHTDNANVKRTPSSFDRSKEPDFGKPHTIPALDIWNRGLGNGIVISGVEAYEVPTVYFSLDIDAGSLRADPQSPSVPSVTASLMSKGTAFKTPAQLEEALDNLGAQISVSASSQKARIQGFSYIKNFEKTVELVEEVLLHPRWDADELALIIAQRVDWKVDGENDPNSISRREFSKIYYPVDHPSRLQVLETKEQLKAIELNQLKEFYAEHYRPDGAELNIVGAIDPDRVEKAFASLASKWKSNFKRAPVTMSPSLPVEKSSVYFYAMPGAKQSIIRLGRPSIPATHPDYVKVEAANFLLGGAFTSLLNQELRVNKGYTYGIGSNFYASADVGEFSLSTSVRANATFDSLITIKRILENYGREFTEDDLAIMKHSTLRSQALETESLGAKLGFITKVTDLGFSPNYLAEHAAIVDAMTLKEFRDIVAKYVRPDAMRWFVLGDPSQATDFEKLGYGKPVILPVSE